MSTPQLQAADPASWVRLLDVDPDLVEGLPPDRGYMAVSRSAVRTLALDRGPLPPLLDAPNSCLYIISGVVLAESRSHPHVSADIFGPGDLVRSGAVRGSMRRECRLLAPTWVAVLDEDFWKGVAPFPSIQAALIARALAHGEALGARLAITGIRNLGRRLLALLWHLAEAHGRVTREGTVVGLDLSHAVVAQLAGAHRTSVTKTLGELEANGQLTRLPDRDFLLHGSLPGEEPAAG